MRVLNGCPDVVTIALGCFTYKLSLYTFATLLQIVSASSDASVRVWDSKTCDCLTSFRPPQTSTSGEASVNAVHFYPQNPDQIIVCNRSSTVFIMTLHGHVVKSFQSGKREGGDFLACWVSPRGEWIYCLGEDSNWQARKLDAGGRQRTHWFVPTSSQKSCSNLC